MCGIVGVYNYSGEPVCENTLAAMTDALAHRGPDDRGIFTNDYVGFGHRRLSIIDLSEAGHQPMCSNDQNYVITYNGEVYNYRELRGELEALGHTFRSRSDTEVVLNAYIQWGPDCVSKFNGMFAFGIWDKYNQKLFLARDRFGIKPLYYFQHEDTLLFASEIKAFLKHPKFRCGINKGGLVEYFTFQNFITDETLFDSVKILPAGHFALVDRGELAKFSMTQYWDYNFVEPKEPLSHGEYLDELDHLIQQSVKRQLVSDVPIGSYLSGGMDSGTLTALAAKELPYINTFTIGFDLNSASGVELGYDERSKAEHMSYLFKTEHYEMVLKAGDMERCMKELVWHIEEPRVGQSYPNYYAAKLSSKFVKVVLSGAGGDELFAGYPWRYYRAVRNEDYDHYIEKYFAFWQRLISREDTMRVFAPIWDDVTSVSPIDLMKGVFRKDSVHLDTPEGYVNNSLYFETKTFLHGLLVIEDKLSMAHSLETRVPFLDNDLVDFAMTVPVNYKLGNLKQVISSDENEVSRYFTDTKDGKLLLRQAMLRHLPEEIVNRGKQGFSAPDATWFKGDSIDYVKDTLLRPNAFIYDYLDRKAVHGLIDDHLSGKVNRRLLIWSLLNVEEWGNTFLKPKGVDTLG